MERPTEQKLRTISRRHAAAQFEAQVNMPVAPRFKMPETPLIAAGALGGPMCMFLVSPFRNALTLASRDASLSLRGVFQQVFKRGFTGGWVGGVYPSVAAGPQYLCLGPMFHLYESFAGKIGGVILAGATETLCGYGAETKCAQMCVNNAGGKIPLGRIQPVYKPWGPGVGINMTRNVLAMSGMRLISEPMEKLFTQATGSDSALVTCLSDLTANCCAATITMPLHMLFQYTAVTHEMWDRPLVERFAGMRDFLAQHYFPNGRVSSVILRDVALRTGFIATAFTLYQQVEKAAARYSSDRSTHGIIHAEFSSGALSFSGLEDRLKKVLST